MRNKFLLLLGVATIASYAWSMDKKDDGNESDPEQTITKHMIQKQKSDDKEELTKQTSVDPKEGGYSLWNTKMPQEVLDELDKQKSEEYPSEEISEMTIQTKQQQKKQEPQDSDEEKTQSISKQTRKSSLEKFKEEKAVTVQIPGGSVLQKLQRSDQEQTTTKRLGTPVAKKQTEENTLFESQMGTNTLQKAQSIQKPKEDEKKRR
ncbi:MAG: hypothetical protein ACTSXG_02140 [Alphaproteobacteria bacterium]